MPTVPMAGNQNMVEKKYAPESKSCKAVSIHYKEDIKRE